jgi:hypothetical protein
MRESRAQSVTHCGLGPGINYCLRIPCPQAPRVGASGAASLKRALYFGVTRVFVRVLVVEAVIIAALWALGRVFS